MEKKMTRIMVSVSPEVRDEIDTLKKNDFYDKPYAELYRKIIRMGLDKMKEETATCG